MTYEFSVQVRKFSTLKEVDGQWKAEDYKSLLDEMEFGDYSDLSDSELREMCLMSLQDLESDDAALIVLKHIIGDELRDGQLKNMAQEMREEKLWEEYVDPAFHGRLFKGGSLLFAAQPTVFPKPDAVSLTIEIGVSDGNIEGLLFPIADAALLVRILAGGMDDHAVLNRLYEEQIKGEAFPNASGIIWMSKTQELDQSRFLVDVISSGYWMDPLAGTEAFSVQAFVQTSAEN